MKRVGRRRRELNLSVKGGSVASFFSFVVTCYQREPLPCTEKRKKESVVLDPPLLR